LPLISQMDDRRLESGGYLAGHMTLSGGIT
jgi:hypothetical protein